MRDDELFTRRVAAAVVLVLAAVFDIYGLWPTRSRSALCTANTDGSDGFLLAALLLVVFAGVLRPRLGGWMWLAYAAGVLALLWRFAAGLGCIG